MTEREFAHISEKLTSIGQHHLLRYWNSLSTTERKQLLKQIDSIDIPTFQLQQDLLKDPQENSHQTLTPFQGYETKGSQKNIEAGQKLIAQGKVGCLVVAGGQGSRLRFDGPKGTFPVTLIKRKSLFQLLAEKVLAASKQAKQDLPLAVMTSPANHQQTIDFFQQHHFFDLKPNQVDFFFQEELPLLDTKGNLILETKGKIAEGADGNGTALKHFVKKGIFAKWHQKGIQYLNFVLIDNPLADPFDAALLGFHQDYKADMVIKCVERKNPSEKVGVLARNGDKIQIVEYTELPKEDFEARNQEGTLKYNCANISLFSFSMDFLKNIPFDEIPFHKALKAIKFLDVDQTTKMADKPMAWKFEKFIFDLIPYAKTVKALLYPREECFSPLKNESGPDSISEVQQALQYYDKITFQKITGNLPPNHPFELSPQFYYPTPDLLTKWKGKNLPPSSYIDP